MDELLDLSEICIHKMEANLTEEASKIRGGVPEPKHCCGSCDGHNKNCRSYGNIPGYCGVPCVHNFS